MRRLTCTVLAGALLALLLASQLPAQGSPTAVDRIIINGRPPVGYRVPAAVVKRVDAASGVNTLSGVPAFDWSYGCSATAAAMLAGYYDRHGYPYMYAGTAGGGVCPLDNSGNPIGSSGHCSLSATEMGLDGRTTRGHVDDYWVSYLSTAPDPYITNGWPEHDWEDCTGDFMGTNQSALDNTDGSTSFYYNPTGDPLYDYNPGPGSQDGCHGLRLFMESRGYAVQTNFNQYIKGAGSIPNKGFTFSQYVAEIDAGRPVLLHVTNHTLVGIGYDTAGSVVYVHDTWDWSVHQMTWGGSYDGRAHYGVTVIRLASVSATLNHALSYGWNMVGYGTDATPAVPAAQVCFSYMGETRTWAEAVYAGWINSVGYYYEQGYGYKTLEPSGGNDDYMRPGVGYWIKTNVEGLTLVVPEL